MKGIPRLLHMSNHTIDRPSWRALIRLAEEELSQYDIAVVNLACAAELPGWSAIDVGRCLSRLDEWAEAVRSQTARSMREFRKRPEQYENSSEYFRILVMITVLQRDLGVKYNPAKIPAEVLFEPADSFIHGILQGEGGTCATLPVVYAAVGRRLGYPIKLVSAMSRTTGHLFARWEDPRTSTRPSRNSPASWPSGRGVGRRRATGADAWRLGLGRYRSIP